MRIDGVPQREQYLGEHEITSLEFADAVRRVGPLAFADCVNLQSVAFGECMEDIGASAFRGCTSLRTLEFPSGLAHIWNLAFMNCTGLEAVLITSEEGLVIDESAFMGCTSLRDVVIEEGLSEIARNTFKGCSALEEIELPGNVERICADAFAECSSLGRVSFLPGINDIVVEPGAFRHCAISEEEVQHLVAEENQRRQQARVQPHHVHIQAHAAMVPNMYGRTLFVCVNNTWGRQYVSSVTHERVSLKDCARGYWYIAGSYRARQAEYLMAVCHGSVEGVWRINQERGWMRPADTPKVTWPEDQPTCGRVGCELMDVSPEEWNRFVGTRPSDAGIEMRGGHIHYSFDSGNAEAEAAGVEVFEHAEVPQIELSDQATGFDLNGVQIVLDPGPIEVFKQALLHAQYARRILYYADGRVEVGRWNAHHFTTDSSLLGNIRTSGYFRNYMTNGLQRVVLQIPQGGH